MLAVAHLDPDDGVMSPGHKVDATDLAALRAVLAHVSATSEPRKEINCTGASTQVASPPGRRIHGKVSPPFAARIGFTSGRDAQ